MPITSPDILNSGPPELPLLIGASVWMKSSYGPCWMSRPRDETIPAVTVPDSPNGLPLASTQSPPRALSLSPNDTAGSGLALSGSSFAVYPVAGGGILATAAGVSLDTTVAARKFLLTIGDGSSTSYTVTHNLNTRDVTVQVYQTASPYGTVEVDVNRTDANDVSVVFASAPASGAYRVVVIG